MSKKLVAQTNEVRDECYTPEYAIKPLMDFIGKKIEGKIIWDCAYGTGKLAKHFNKLGFEVVGEDSLDFLDEDLDCDVIITNPPYSKKDEFIERCFKIGKPFALLLPLTALEGIKRGKIFMENKIQLIIPNRRINFMIESGKKSCWFTTAWFCGNMNLENDLNFVILRGKNKAK